LVIGDASGAAVALAGYVGVGAAPSVGEDIEEGRYVQVGTEVVDDLG
jgi:hypothetical protein